MLCCCNELVIANRNLLGIHFADFLNDFPKTHTIKNIVITMLLYTIYEIFLLSRSRITGTYHQKATAVY